MERTYQITLMNWLTRTKRTFLLDVTKSKAIDKLRVLRKRHSKFWWIKTTPIHCL